MDVEETVQSFSVRKVPLMSQDEAPAAPTNAAAVNNRSNKTHVCIPLMLRHLKASKMSIPPAIGAYKQICNDRVNFRYCLVYGRIIAVFRRDDSLTKYILDDGTDCLKVCVFNENEKSESLQRLENEMKAVDDHITNGQSEVIEGLKEILLKIKEQVDQSNIKIGSKVFVLGRPHIYKGEVSIHAFSISIDDIQSPDNEIAFKRLLLHWYNENVFH